MVRAFMATLLVLLMVAGSAGLGVAALAAGSQQVSYSSVAPSGNSQLGAENWKSKVDPSLLNPEIYVKSGHLPVGVKLSTVLEQVKSEFAKRLDTWKEGKVRVIVYFTGGDEAVRAIKQVATVASGARLQGASSGYLIVWASMDEVEQLAKLPYVVSIVPDMPHQVPEPRSDALYEQAGGNLTADIYGATDIMGAQYAWSLGYKGDGVKVAVVDTGVDMGESDLGEDALARDAYGAPLLFDADEMGLVLTLNSATYVGNGSVLIDPHPFIAPNLTGIVFYDGYDGGLYITNYTLMFVYDRSTGNYSYLAVPVAGSLYGVPPEIGNNTVAHFGLASQNIWVGNFFVWYLAPVLSVDLDGDGSFDGAYADLSTMYYLFMYSLYSLGYAPEPDPAFFDLSFADEQLLNFNNPIAARDFTGDGVNDFSLGAIAGAFNDVNAVFGDNTTFDWWADFETLGYILPGYDSYYGLFLDFEFDFESHGTFCAHVIASRGVVPRPLGYGDIYYNLTGVAPGAKVGGATALWNGNVIIAELYFSGFTLVDPQNFTWAYTGWTQADVISNSWGSSYLIINGYASDADPVSLWEDFLTLATGTVIVHAAGNGGPGYGTVTMAGTATSVITAGASTEFLYRPVYGYLPGAYYQVVSWSDRGPTQFAYPKPDVVNVGSFAWAVGRVIDGLGDGVWAFDLFGGTSEATPMTAGAVAILIQALKDNGYNVTPQLVKTLLKSSARHLGYDAFVEGTGHVDLRDAIDRITSGGFIAYSSAPSEVGKYFDDTMAAMLGLPKSTVDALLAQDEDTALYFDVVKPGTSASRTLDIEPVGPAGAPALEAKALYLERTASIPVSKAVDLAHAVLLLRTSSGYQLLPVPNGYVVVLGDYIFMRLDKIPAGSRLLIPMNEALLSSADFAQIDAYYPYKLYDPYGRNGTYNFYFIMGVETSYWIDYNNDGLLLPQETARIQYDIRYGNAFHVPIGKPAQAFQLAKKEALEYLQDYYGINASNSMMSPVLDIRIFYNLHTSSQSPVIMPLKVRINLYNWTGWDWVTPQPVPGGFNVTVTVPEGTKPGVYEGFLKVYNETAGLETYVPISVSVPFIVKPGVPAVATGGDDTIYKNYVFTGALDQGWRPETGDWRVYPILVEDYTGQIVALKARVMWSDPSSSFDIAINGPGVNYWGVANWSNATWIDAATVAAKISAVSRYVGASGVYTYFDWPSNRASEIIAPIGNRLFDPDSRVYWLVVHQIFQGRDPDRVLLQVIPLGLNKNTLNVKQGGTNALIATFYSQNLGSAYLLGAPIVIPLTGGSPTDISVTLLPGNLTYTPIKTVMLIAQASPTASGSYLVMVPYYSLYPSVIWGGNVNGTITILYAQPTIFYMSFLVNVTTNS
ncbi:MAG: S8 family serine peptidase [Desulfurococcales archaeon]|nr:S8 family serine peptidase [Desulfurococcales archaeon]